MTITQRCMTSGTEPGEPVSLGGWQPGGPCPEILRARQQNLPPAPPENRGPLTYDVTRQGTQATFAFGPDGITVKDQLGELPREMRDKCEYVVEQMVNGELHRWICEASVSVRIVHALRLRDGVQQFDAKHCPTGPVSAAVAEAAVAEANQRR